MEDNETKEIAIVQSAVTITEAEEQIKFFSKLKQTVLSSDDKIRINGNPYIKKTGWRKIKTFFNLCQEILQCTRLTPTDDSFMWVYRVRVSHKKTGAYTDAEMACSSTEKFSNGKPETAIMAMAQTRAFNRAISDLVGGGEVTAEEIDTPDGGGVSAPPAKPTAQMPDKKVCTVNGCGVDITAKVYEFSMSKFGIPACMNCQKKLKEAQNNR